MQATLFETKPEHPPDPFAYVPQECRETFLAFKRTWQDEAAPRATVDAWARHCGVKDAAEQLKRLIDTGCIVEGPEGLRFV